MPQPLEFQVDGKPLRSWTLDVVQMRMSPRFPKWTTMKSLPAKKLSARPRNKISVILKDWADV
jgi:hypothetical protein